MPGGYPIAWCRKYGQGNVFYTSLSHREDVWESPTYRPHLLGGIKCALGLEKGDATPLTLAYQIGPTGGELEGNVNEPGPVMLQGGHGTVAFRNLRLKPL